MSCTHLSSGENWTNIISLGAADRRQSHNIESYDRIVAAIDDDTYNGPHSPMARASPGLDQNDAAVVLASHMHAFDWQEYGKAPKRLLEHLTSENRAQKGCALHQRPY